MNSSNKSKSFEKSGFLVLFLSIFGSGLNYLFQILSGRILDTASYGELNSLFSIVNIVTVLGTALSLGIVKYVAEKDNNFGGSIIKIFKQSSVVGLVVFALLTGILTYIFKFNLLSSLLSSFSIALFSLSYVFYGVLQGKKDFMGVSIFNLIQPVFKITLGILGILLMVKLNVAIPYNIVFVIMSVASVVACLFAYLKSKKIGINYTSEYDNVLVKNIYKFFLFSLMSSICLVIFNNIDILIIRQFFDETTVGYYSSAALFGKIILYIPTAFTIMMVPLVAENPHNSGKVLKKTLIYAGGLSSFSAVILYLLRNFIIKILMGEKYLASADYILPVCVMILPLVFVTVLVNYLLAAGYEKFATATSAFAVIMMLVSAYFVHQYVETVLYIFTAIYICLLIVLSVKCVLCQTDKTKTNSKKLNKVGVKK